MTVTRKGGRRQTLPVPPLAAGALDALLDGLDVGPVFRTASGRRWDRRAAARVLERLARRAGVARANPHSFRHAWVTTAIESGASIYDVSTGAGHRDVRTTARYDRRRLSLDRSPSYAVAAAFA